MVFKESLYFKNTCRNIYSCYIYNLLQNNLEGKAVSGITDETRLAMKKYLLGDRNKGLHYTILSAFVYV